MIDEPFSRGGSPLHRLDPRCKSLAAIAISFVVAVAPSLPGPLLALAASAVLVLLGRLPGKALFRRLGTVNLFVLFLWLALPLTYPGDTAAQWGPLTLSRQGLDMALLITVKSNAIFLTFLALVATTDAPTEGHALRRLGAPGKLVFLFLFTYRYIHVIGQEFERLSTAARLRGFAPRTNMHTYRTYANMFGMVLLRSLDRSRRVYEAMLLRGFNGEFRSLRRFHAGRADLLFGASMFALTATLVWLELPKGFLHG